MGSLATFAWLATGLMQNLVGQTIQATGSYVASMALMGLAPFLAFLFCGGFGIGHCGGNRAGGYFVTHAEQGRWAGQSPLCVRVPSLLAPEPSSLLLRKEHAFGCFS